jgi:hypothetical protein
MGGVHIGASALLDIHLIWFGYIARLSQWGGGVAETPQPPLPPPSFGLTYCMRLLLVGQDRRHLFVIPCPHLLDAVSRIVFYNQQPQPYLVNMLT